ncbi:MAG: hypothetical protein IKB95_06405 [Bacteroidales bacterium]|nr:hypothetical protein [Bacteroidales bacterium]
MAEKVALLGFFHILNFIFSAKCILCFVGFCGLGKKKRYDYLVFQNHFIYLRKKYALMPSMSII